MQRLTIRPRPARGLAPLWAATILCMSAAAMPAHAQWQRNFGVPSSEDGGTAVAQTSDGGFIVAGYGDANVASAAYAARTDQNGNRIWDRKYYFGTSATSLFNDVKVCANGDYILVGQVGAPASTVSSLLAMRIDGNGNIIWSRQIGDGQLGYSGASVIETRFGNGTTTHAGDIVIGGTVRDDANHTIRGVILRLTADGNTIWNRRYDGGTGYSDTRIFSVVETQLTQSGDIAAAGDAMSGTTGLDVMILRVDGSTGTIGASPQGVGMFDADGGSSDYAFSLVERQLGTFNGDLVIAGASTALPSMGSYTLLMLETRPDPSDVAGPRGSTLAGWDFSSGFQGASAREITDPASPLRGDIMVGGFAIHPSFPSPDLRGFLQPFSPVTLITTSPFHTYGTVQGRTVGTGITECSSALGAPGFALTGTFPAYGPGLIDNDLWLLRTDVGIESCEDVIVPIVLNHPPTVLYRPTLTPAIPSIRIICGVQALRTDWGNEICRIPEAPTKIEAIPEETPGGELSLLGIHPNIVRQGETFTLASTSEAGRGEIVVGDMAGREIYRAPLEKASGTASTTISTDGWTPGAYLLNLTLNGIVRTGHITVVR